MTEPAPDEIESLAGRLLIAMPGISDPRFERAVVLVCIHSAQHAMGVRVNKPVEDTTVGAVLTRLDVGGAPRNPHQLVLAGGPVETERGFVLHSDDYEIPGSTMQIGEGLRLTATREVLQALADPAVAPKRSMLALGYAGWGPGQLETELRENVWLTAPLDLDLLFDEDHDGKWSRALARMGISSSHLSGQTGRA
ncbi:YqgE/AlgH family protein [Caulobacter sp. 17J80-11]|uniref:YqgE/AlgH family protein n=1 Tax=Caulobacter sp. 17J80-11 TaxID=2763502 RepID=UPI001653E91F|nr:YqgE/AlgH family protein [Caulobacter sp. 17J80-11]MBC6983484.1 YqgE/AlgH family protein [Caulobacter sp. 17J80-11]